MKDPIFAIDSCSLVDRIQQQIPVFRRGSPVCLLSYRPDKPVSIRMIRSYQPAVYEDGSILIEKGATPLLTRNTDFSHPTTWDLWKKGQYVNVYPSGAIAPDGQKRATLINWSAAASGSSQKLQRSFTLIAEKTYTISFLVGLQRKGGAFNDSGEIRVVGDVQSTPFKLATLNNYPGEYRFISVIVKAGGRQPRIPMAPVGQSTADITQQFYSVLSVSGNSVVIQLYNVKVDDLKGGQIIIQGVDKKHLITSNSASDINTGKITIVTSTSNLEAYGIVVNSKIQIASAPEQNATLEFYSETSATLMFAGVFLEEGEFPTSPIIDDRGELRPRAKTEIYYQRSAIEELTTFGLFFHLNYWQGDGNIFNAGNFRVFIQNNKLTIVAGAIQSICSIDLPRYDLRVFIQVALETSSLSIYINGVLRAYEKLPPLKAERSTMTLTTEGVRVLKHLFLYDTLISGGVIELGAKAEGDIAWLFENADQVIPASLLSGPPPTLILPSSDIPGMAPPKASGIILSVNSLSKAVGVSSTAGFAVGDMAVVLRGTNQITWTSVTKVSTAGSSLELENVNGINVMTDTIVVGNFEEPGRMSIRLPFEIAASGKIDILYRDTTSVRVPSTLSFKEGRAFIQDSSRVDIRECMILSIDSNKEQLKLDSLDDIKEGYFIIQPELETLISPLNYEVTTLRPQSGLVVGAEKAENSFVVKNRTKTTKAVTFLVKVNL